MVEFKLVLNDEKVDTVLVTREFTSSSRDKDFIQRENLTSYFGERVKAMELIAGNFDILKDVNKVKIVYIPRISKGEVEIWFKPFRICDN